MKSGAFNPDKDFHRSNPLLKIPALQIAPDNSIIDSPVICEYLNAFSLQDNIYPIDQTQYFFQRKLESIADGATDATVLRRYESLRPPNLFSEDFDCKQKLKVEHSLDYLESISHQFTTPYMIGEISVMCLLSYLDLRFPKDDWRSTHPKLTDWYKDCQTWEPFQATTLG